MNSAKSTLLTGQITNIILSDYAQVMKTTGNTISKFILIAIGIEFLGACLDKQSIKSTARGEKRFTSAIAKLFPGKYHHFVRIGSLPNLYNDFRCPIIHQFKAEKSISLCSREDAGSAKHLTYNAEGALILVAEDFYDDLANAARLLINR